jgi:hypothetical protein
MIFWIIFLVISLITGATVIAFSGEPEEVPEDTEQEPDEVPEEPDEDEPAPPPDEPNITFSSSSQQLPAGGSNVTFYSYIPSGMSGTISNNLGWSLPATVSSGQQNFSMFVSQSGIYTLTVTDPASNRTYTKFVEIAVYPDFLSG